MLGSHTVCFCTPRTVGGVCAGRDTEGGGVTSVSRDSGARGRESVLVSVCVCVCKRERECVCVCV